MKKLLLSIAYTVFLLAGVAASSQATHIGFEFEGETDYFFSYDNDPVSVAFRDKYLGAPFTGYFEIQYDPFQQPQQFFPATYLSWFFPVRFQINFEDFAFDSGGYVTDYFQFSFSSSDSGSGFGVISDTVYTSPSFPLVYTSNNTIIGFDDNSNTGFSDALSPTGLPMNIDASKFNKGGFSVAFQIFPQEALGQISPDGDEIQLMGSFNVTNFNVYPVPEPSTMILLGVGLVGLAGWRRKKKY